MQEVRIRTERQSQLVDVTSLVRESLADLRDAAAVLVYVPHTTAGVTINEHADPAVARDFETALERIVPEDWSWQHIEEGEENAFHPGRTGRNHLRTIARAAGIGDARVDEVLAQVGLTEAATRRTKGYSLGMKQRLSLAGALLGDPQVLVLDEPANGLDPQGIRWLRDLLRALAAEGRTVLVSSHVLTEMAQLADDVVILAKGRLVTQAPMATVVAGGGGTRARSPERDRLAAALRAAGIEATSAGPDGLRAGSDAARVGEVAAAEGIVLHELTTEAGSLEDVFLELTGDPEAAA